jgi:RNA polymerase sigma-70 factor (ECF subfamily)
VFQVPPMPRPSRSLEDCMAEYQAGNVTAFEELYSRTAPRARVWLAPRVRSAERIEDLVQKVFLNLHRSRHQFRAGEVFDAWFFSILRNAWIDELRRAAGSPGDFSGIPIEDAPEGHPALQSEQPQEGDQELPVGQLPVHHREAIELRYQEGLEFAGMARKWNVTEAVARKRVSRAIQALREILGIKAGGGEP